MTELRLLPAAFACWLGVALMLYWQRPEAFFACVVVAGLTAVWSKPQALLVFGVSGVSQFSAWLYVVRSHASCELVVGRLHRRISAGGGELWKVGEASVWIRDPPEVALGAEVAVRGFGTPADFKAAEVLSIEPASGVWAFPQLVREAMVASSEHLLHPPARGLLPAMTLGDTSLQSAEEQQAYIVTGLAHLSAVSGGNVAIVTSAVAVALGLVRAPPRAQQVSALVALGLYVWVVGPEPSVIRAGIMGLVGLVAVLKSTRAPAMHTLSIAVIVMMVWLPEMALNFGFLLSVAATAGIVALSPVFAQLIECRWVPPILARAIAVAIAAEIATAPIVAIMAGHVSLVSVIANVLAAPAVPLVTLAGLIAALLAIAPGQLEWIPLALAQPAATWIGVVARVGASLPHGTIALAGPLGVAWVALAGGWVCYLIGKRRAGWIPIVGVIIVILCVLFDAPTANSAAQVQDFGVVHSLRVGS